MSSLPFDARQQWVWPAQTEFTSSADGLINATWLARDAGQLLGVVQRLNTRIFVPEVHEDIHAVTAHLDSAGLLTPKLVPTTSGELWATTPSGVYRRLTPVGTDTVHALGSASQARSAGRLVGRFHSALTGFEHEFRSVRAGAHDTHAHMAGLASAVDIHRSHRLYDQVASLAERIARLWQSWDGQMDGPTRVIHGDLKVSNLRWSGGEAVAVIDLDTMQVSTLAIELGDAFRSWCNRSSESDANSVFDVEFFAAAIHGYAEVVMPDPEEWQAIVPGIERIATELAARFARDALEERYFGFDEAYGTRGDHNLLRAMGQLSLAESVRAQRVAAEAVMV
ncbi:MAG: Ser/Thr protein kinase RdoA (MazF antagonist) [Myxococcota bacterium]|jgi:Ser/Thr protein kinase RdoA (MazF antagonist)